jgi:hypothetical protein
MPAKARLIRWLAVVAAALLAVAACTGSPRTAAQATPAGSISPAPQGQTWQHLPRTAISAVNAHLAGICKDTANWSDLPAVGGSPAHEGVVVDESVGAVKGCRFVFLTDSKPADYYVGYLPAKIGVRTTPTQPVTKYVWGVYITVDSGMLPSVQPEHEWEHRGVPLVMVYTGGRMHKVDFEVAFVSANQPLPFTVSQFSVPGYAGEILAVVFRPDASNSATEGRGKIRGPRAQSCNLGFQICYSRKYLCSRSGPRTGLSTS